VSIDPKELLSATIQARLTEDRKFPPSAEFVKQANVNDPSIYESAAADVVKFWEGQAEKLSWFKKWDKAFEWTDSHAKWFLDGKLNVSYNCLDRHLTTERRNKAAIIFEGEPGDKRTLTYWELHREVCTLASALKSMGIAKGDRVTIYLPMIPEAAIAMLACARIGAAHSVVFGGFSADALRESPRFTVQAFDHRRWRVATRQRSASQSRR
jgi:acetyl-CoA synthetase